MPVHPNLPDLAQTLERVDQGQVVELARFRERVGSTATIERPEPLDPEDVNRVADSLATAREELVRRAMRTLDEERDREGASDLHLRVGLLVLDLEEIQRELAVRVGGRS